MNEKYQLLFRAIGLPDSLVDCAMGRITLRVAGFASPPDWFVFPPALCPIWSNASLPSYLGLWKHWFTSRNQSFVAMQVWSGRKATEIARTPEQLFSHAIIQAICVHDGLTQPIEEFATAVGIANLSELNKATLSTGDNPLGYAAISQFENRLPLSSVADTTQYTGDFPTGEFNGAREWWNDACFFEVPDELLASWPDTVSKPPWFQHDTSKAEGFEAFLQVGDYRRAWLMLNQR